MKFLLLLSLFHPGEPTDVIRYEVRSEYQCQLDGASLSRDILTKIPGVSSTSYVCVEKGYGE